MTETSLLNFQPTVHMQCAVSKTHARWCYLLRICYAVIEIHYAVLDTFSMWPRWDISGLNKLATFIKPYLVRILHDEVFTVVELFDDIQYTSEYTPGILHIQVHLLSKLSWFKLLQTEDYMISGITWHSTRHKTIEQKVGRDIENRWSKTHNIDQIKKNFIRFKSFFKICFRI